MLGKTGATMDSRIKLDKNDYVADARCKRDHGGNKRLAYAGKFGERKVPAYECQGCRTFYSLAEVSEMQKTETP